MGTGIYGYKYLEVPVKNVLVLKMFLALKLDVQLWEPKISFDPAKNFVLVNFSQFEAKFLRSTQA